MARADGTKHAESLQRLFDIKFPCAIVDFMAAEVQARLPAALEAWFITTDISMTLDYRPLMQAASTLGVRDVITIGETGPTVFLPPGLRRLRQNEAIRTLVETGLLCEIDLETLRSDLCRMYGVDVDESDIRRYAELFVDREYIEGTCWDNYTRCIGTNEAVFRRCLIGQPKDFVRWRLGVPVSMNADDILNRLVSDAYYTERLIKRQAGNLGLELTKEEIARVKLERDTMFKALEMRSKIKESAGGDTAKQALATLAGVVAKYESQDSLLSRDELKSAANG